MDKRLQAVALGLAIGHAYLLGVRVFEHGNPAGFVAFYTAGQMVSSDPTVNPYLTPEFLAAQAPLLQDMAGAAWWLNPPTALLLYAPFALLPYGVALGLWLAIGLACWVGAHRLIQRNIHDAPLGALLSVGLLLLPLTIWVQYAQATGLVMFLLTAAYVLLQRGREGAAGAVLSLLAFKPQLALGMTLALAVKGRWRALVAGTLGGAAQLAVALALWPEQFRYFVEALDEIRRLLFSSPVLAHGVHTVDGFWHLAGLPELAAHLTTVAVLALLVLGWRRVAWEPASEQWRRAMAATIAAGLLLGIQLWTYDLGLMLLPGFILAGVGERRALVPAAIACLLGPPLAWAMYQGVGGALQITVPVLLGTAWAVWPRGQRAPAALAVNR